MNLKNRTILITGGGRGIGLALVEVLAKDNKVLITGRSEETLNKVKTRLPNISTYVSDVAELAQINLLKEKIQKEHPSLDILFNNAGIAQKHNLTEPQSDDTYLTQEIDVNLKGPIRMINAFLPMLKTKNEAAIVNISSGLAYLPFPSQAIYGSTKAALHSYTLSLRNRLIGSSVKVFEVFPPVVETDMTAKVHGYAKMNVNVHAQKVLAAIAKDKLEIRPGVSSFLYYASRLMPGYTLKQLAKSN